MGHYRNWMPFEEARAFVRQLNLKNGIDWLDYIESGNFPTNIPKTPQQVYKDKGWNGFGDWLGNGAVQTQKREYLSFKDARRFARLLHLKQYKDWSKYCKSGLKPSNIPSAPDHVYKKQGWAGMYDWLGIDRSRRYKKEHLPYEKAREYVHTLKFKSIIEWRNWCRHGKNPDNIPVSPNYYYKNKGWNGWRDWLGNNSRHISKNNYWPFKQAREYVRKQKIKDKTEWLDWCLHRKNPENIPATPSYFYKNKGWLGWKDWLGTF
jgi:hypothetical protein